MNKHSENMKHKTKTLKTMNTLKQNSTQKRKANHENMKQNDKNA